MENLSGDAALLVLTAGTTQLGHVENFLSPAVLRKCGEHDIPIHVDAAFGGLNLGLLPRELPQVQRLMDVLRCPQVASITIDPHKAVGSMGNSVLFKDPAVYPSSRTANYFQSSATMHTGTTLPVQPVLEAKEIVDRVGSKIIGATMALATHTAQKVEELLAGKGIEPIYPASSRMGTVRLDSMETVERVHAHLRDYANMLVAKVSFPTTDGPVYGIRYVIEPSYFYDREGVAFVAGCIARAVQLTEHRDVEQQLLREEFSGVRVTAATARGWQGLLVPQHE